jgi:hypothetical protein
MIRIGPVEVKADDARAFSVALKRAMKLFSYEAAMTTVASVSKGLRADRSLIALLDSYIEAAVRETGDEAKEEEG